MPMEAAFGGRFDENPDWERFGLDSQFDSARSLDDAFAEGRKALICGGTLYDCSYSALSPERTAWIRGYRTGFDEQEARRGNCAVEDV